MNEQTSSIPKKARLQQLPPAQPLAATEAFDVFVLGGGPAGLAAAIAAQEAGSHVFLAEREAQLGGVLKQCIHDGFGLHAFGERLSGPEYVERFIDRFHQLGIKHHCLCFVTRVERREDGLLQMYYVYPGGLKTCTAKTLILATGCRERTARQVQIHGTRPAGILTAGACQHYVNLLGQLPAKRCVILGSGDIGLIMARRLRLEGAEVVGVFEAKSSPSGLTRNLVQCLEDYDIPLHLSHTVTRVFGADRVEAVEISQVDENLRPLPGSEYRVECDALILSVGLIPENEMAERLGVRLDPRTKGPYCDEDFMTSVEGVFCCGNALHVNDLVDYVSENARLAGVAASRYAEGMREMASDPLQKMELGEGLLYFLPQVLRWREGKLHFYFRAARPMAEAQLQWWQGDRLLYQKKYRNLKPPEMETLVLAWDQLSGLHRSQAIQLRLVEGGKHDSP